MEELSDFIKSIPVGIFSASRNKFNDINAKIQLCLYSIYDGYLNEEYGSNSKYILKNIMESINIDLSEEDFICPHLAITPITIKTALINVPPFKISEEHKQFISKLSEKEWIILSDYFHIAYSLKELQYFRYSEKKSCVVIFGTRKHQTILFIMRKNDKYLCTHINTGYGQSQINFINNKKYFNPLNSFKEISDFDDFLQFIKSCLFMKYAHYHTPDNYEFFMNLNHIHEVDTNSNYKKDFLNKVINTPDQINNYYNYLSLYFNETYENDEIKKRYIIFSRAWQQKISDIKTQYTGSLTYRETENKFVYMAMNKLEFIIKDGEPYLNMQMSGTCVYRSYISTIIHYLLMNGNTDDQIVANNIVETMHNLFLNCCDLIDASIINIYLQHTEHINSHRLIRKMIDDRVINKDYDFYNLLNKNMYIYMNREHNDDNIRIIQTIHVIPPISDIEDFINKIRKKEIRTIAEIKEKFKIYETINTYNDKITECGEYMCYFVISSLLCIYYNSDTVVNNNNYIDPMRSLIFYKLKLSINEINYIYRSISEHRTNAILNDIKDVIPTYKTYYFLFYMRSCYNICETSDVSDACLSHTHDALNIEYCNKPNLYDNSDIYELQNIFKLILRYRYFINYSILRTNCVNMLKRLIFKLSTIKIENDYDVLVLEQEHKLYAQLLCDISNIINSKLLISKTPVLELKSVLTLNNYFNDICFIHTTHNILPKINYVKNNDGQFDKKIVSIFKNIISTSNNDSEIIDKINALTIYDIIGDINKINNKLIKSYNNSQIEFNKKTYFKSQIQCNHILIRYLQHGSKNIFYATEDYKNILCIMPNGQFEPISTNNKDKYDNEEDYLLHFEIEDQFNIDKMTLNNKPVIISNDIQKYPFLLYAPYFSLNFIHNNNNNYQLTIIRPQFISLPMDHPLSNVIKKTKKETLDGYCINLYIKHNLLTPHFDEFNFKYLQKIYECCDNYYPFISANKKTNITPKNLFSEINISKKEIGILNTTIYLDDIEPIELITSAIMDDNIKYDLVDDINLLTYEPEKHDVKYPIINTGIFSDDYNLFKQQIQKFMNNHLSCHLNCSFSGEIYSEIIETIKLFEKYRDSIKFDPVKIKQDIRNIDSYDIYYQSLIDFIYYNLSPLQKLLQINSFLSNLYRLENIFKDKCDPLSCYEVIEVHQLTKVDTSKAISYLDAIVEIIFGNILKDDQWDKYEAIKNNYHNSGNKWEVHHFMMGKGKSSIITPLICIYMYFDKLKPIIVIPEHLEQQTIDTMCIFNHLIGDSYIFDVYTDYQIKMKFLDDKTKKENNISNDHVLVIDEFDFLFDPFQSNLNRIIKQKNIENYQDIFDEILSCIDGSKSQPTNIYSREYEIYQTIHNKKLIPNITYGMSKKDLTNRICIPYLRQDSPCEGSLFKSIIVSITLTVKYFELKDFYLEEPDLELIFKNKQSKLIKMLCQYYKVTNPFKLNKLIDNFRTHDKLSDKNFADRVEIFYNYMLYLLSKIKISTEIENCSFIDIMNLDTQWQVGYTGTVNMDIKDYPFIKYSPHIINDYDELLGVYFALTGTYPTSQNKIHQFPETTNIVRVVNTMKENKYKVLIDGCAYLKNYSNKEVAQQLYNSYPPNKVRVIYVIKQKDKDIKMIIENGIHRRFNNDKINENDLIYYSQRYIVGIDFQQPNIYTGLILLNKTNNYTQIAQAVYRMRKLCRGHVINIGCCDNIGYSSNDNDRKMNIYFYLINEDEKMKKNTDKLLQYQIIKYYARLQTKCYKETNLKMLYEQIDEGSTELDIRDTIEESLSVNVLNRQTIKCIPEFKRLYNDFKSDKISNIISVMYGVNERVTNTITEEAKIVEVDEEASIVAEFAKAINIDGGNIYFDHYFYYEPTIENIIKYITINIEGRNERTLIFSKNLFHENLYSIIIVEIDKNKYLIDLLKDHFYVNKYPIYSLYGIMLNHGVLSKIKGKTYEQKININTIFDITVIEKDKNVLNMAEILNPYYNGIISKYHLQKKMQKDDVDKIVLLFQHLINRKMCSHTEEIYNKLSMYNVSYDLLSPIKDADKVTYKRIIDPIIAQDLNKNPIDFEEIIAAK
jgi:hypothetical protein